MAFIDITGQTYNELTAIRCIDVKNRLWEWKCSCGKTCIVRKYDVTSGRQKSCGHLTNRGGVHVKPGDTFGEWEVIDNIDSKYVLCKCSCGKERKILNYDLRKGNTKSCGHLTKGTCTNGRKDMTGQQIGEWSIGEYIGNGYYKCICSCGKIKSLKGTYLRTGQSKSCGHASNAFIDLTGQKFGEWEVKKYLGNYMW